MDKNIKKEFGICDNCGLYTQKLALVEDEWFCTGCAGISFTL